MLSKIRSCISPESFINWLMTFYIRPYRDSDLEALYAVCLQTGDSGKDASQLYQDPKLLGHLYAAPYALLEPELAFVLEDDKGVCGYVLAAFDSGVFYHRMQTEWLPLILPQYPNPLGDWQSLNRDEKLIRTLYQVDEELDEELMRDYPSHLHIDLLPRAQKQGQGKRMIQTLEASLLAKGSKGVHLGLGIRNDNAFAFYQHLGFKELKREQGTIVMGKILL